jgi:hypothetical protein
MTGISSTLSGKDSASSDPFRALGPSSLSLCLSCFYVATLSVILFVDAFENCLTTGDGRF